MSGVTVRQATHDDYEDVAAFTRDTWPDRESGDYVPDVFHDWVDADGPDQRTFVAEADGSVVGIVQAVRLSDHEAWYQGMRVHPDYRKQGVSRALNDDCFAWTRSWGGTVARLMVFSWNIASLGAARSGGFAPGTEFRWMHPEPDADAEPSASVVEDPDGAYTFWADSGARDHLRGLALDREESWALSELTRADLRAAAEETAVLAVRRDGRPADGGTKAATFRVRDYERENDDGETVHWADYGVAGWADEAALRDLVAGVSRDAAELGADRTRVLVPETPRHVTDAAHAGVDLADEPDFVLGADLTGTNA